MRMALSIRRMLRPRMDKEVSPVFARITRGSTIRLTAPTFPHRHSECASVSAPISMNLLLPHQIALFLIPMSGSALVLRSSSRPKSLMSVQVAMLPCRPMRPLSVPPMEQRWLPRHSSTQPINREPNGAVPAGSLIVLLMLLTQCSPHVPDVVMGLEYRHLVRDGYPVPILQAQTRMETEILQQQWLL